MSTNTNPFNFVDPLLVNFPRNKLIVCQTVTRSDEEKDRRRRETYFNSSREKPQQRWAYDNYFYHGLQPLNVKQKRADRLNIDRCMESIHKEEKHKAIPSCSQSWYGHRIPGAVLYDETAGLCYGQTNAFRQFYRVNGMPWPKQRREQLSNRNVLDFLKPCNKNYVK